MTLIDVEEELRELEWPGASWSQDKFIAKSLFRDNRSPSFFREPNRRTKRRVADSGATDDYYANAADGSGWSHIYEESALMKSVTNNAVYWRSVRRLRSYRNSN